MAKTLTAAQQTKLDALRPQVEAIPNISAGVWTCLIGLIPQFGADLPATIEAVVAIVAMLTTGNIFGGIAAVVALIEKDAPLAKAVLGCFGVVLP